MIISINYIYQWINCTYRKKNAIDLLLKNFNNGYEKIKNIGLANKCPNKLLKNLKRAIVCIRLLTKIKF